MRVLLYTPAFLPHLGGLEIGQALLADRLTRLGDSVIVVTHTAESAAEAAAAAPVPYRVLRRPGPLALLRAVHWCDVFFQANVSLRGLWPLLLFDRPWAVSHHSWYCRTDGTVAWQDRLKRRLLGRAALSVSVSVAMSRDLATPSRVIANAYRDDLFHLMPEVRRDRDLVFLGRLVSDKGVDLLIDALAKLGERGLRPTLTVVGDGPELPALRAQAARLGVAEQIAFLGARRDGELVPLLNAHRILVMPSRYNEPFGIAALEGIACGCVVVGSSGGGLPEAIGPCGRLFRNASIDDLATVLEDLLRHPGQLETMLAGAPQHLALHASEPVTRRYRAALQEAIGGRPAPSPQRSAG